MFVHARIDNFFQFSSVGQHFSFLKDAFVLLQSHLPCNCWPLLTLSLDAQLLSLHFPCDLQKQYPHSLQRVRCSICLTFNMPADLYLVFLFEAEQRTLACLTPARMPNLSTLRSPFQVSSSAVTSYIISHKPLRIQVKHWWVDPSWVPEPAAPQNSHWNISKCPLSSLGAVFASSRPK